MWVFHHFLHKTLIKTDQHSKNCNKVSKIVTKIDGSQWFDQINFKLEKILLAMESISSKIKCNCSILLKFHNKYLASAKEYSFYQRTKSEDSQILNNLIEITRQIFRKHLNFLKDLWFFSYKYNQRK